MMCHVTLRKGTGRPWTLVLCFLALLLIPAVKTAAAGGLAEAVVSVVGLNEQGEPSRQGLGVVLGKEGRILTSAALLAPGGGGIVKTAAGNKYLIRHVLYWDFFEDLALVQVEAEALTAVPLASSRCVAVQEQVQVGVRHNPPSLKGARVAKTLSLSPRLILLKLNPRDLDTDLGAPIFNDKGDLVGMLHSFAGEEDKSQGVRLFLSLDRSHLPEKKSLHADDPPQWPANQMVDPSFRASRAFWAGVMATRRQDWPRAREKFSATLRHPGSWPEASYGRGVARYYLGDYEGAGQDFLQATRALPGYGLAFLWLGRARARQGKPEEALAAYQKAAAADPGLSEAWFHWGMALYQHGDLSKAQECLEKAGDDFPQAAQRWWYLGNIAQTHHQPEKALEAFHRARKLDPKFLPAYVEEARLLIGLGRPQEAAPLLAEVVQSKPEWARARYYLGLAYFRSANTAGAWEQYCSLQKIHPEMAIRLVSILERNY
jgi:tetratricopeptide (TPR) repeat protein